MSRLSSAVSAIALLGALASVSAEAAVRAYVRSDGNDGNAGTGCLLNNPCRTFATAHSVVDPGGEIVALDAAGYGPVTITKSVTITANPGYFAGIAASSGTAVTIATAAVEVTLRGLNINSIGASIGVSMTDGARLSVDNCVIQNFTGNGVEVHTGATVRIVDSLIRDNNYGVHLNGGATATILGSKILDSTGIGVFVQGNLASTTTSASISDSAVTGGNTGIHAAGANASGTGRISVVRSTISHALFGAVLLSNVGTAVITIGNSMLSSNGTALYNSGTGTTLETLGNNTVRQNSTNTSGTITTVPMI